MIVCAITFQCIKEEYCPKRRYKSKKDSNIFNLNILHKLMFKCVIDLIYQSRKQLPFLTTEMDEAMVIEKGSIPKEKHGDQITEDCRLYSDKIIQSSVTREYFLNKLH